ncbi:MAG: tRNA (uridine(34)/cytosine(34)/5-carboxymethylaminomethyluridine(34)-2'-O)-methyltransferase TrmL [Negativicutes bacterium]|nr:tRNA (uridine(34)/cytosine(34)/5-carboxymethylaminomethyluridine(34)-2'-O)-methyltransferase TrmL [Negativicutes bacterium]
MSIHIVLYQPEIPPNTGNIARLCAATDSVLHLVKPLGFSLEDKYLKRAGLDYWQYLRLEIHQDWQAFLQTYTGKRMFFATTKGHTAYHHMAYRDEDFLVFGPETRGLPPEVLSLKPDHNIRIPILAETRSLNLSNAVAIILFEALRQTGFDQLCDGEI